MPSAPRVAITYELSIPSDYGPIPARFYRGNKDETPCPLLVYFHGGGWAMGSFEGYDTVCRLATKAGCTVMSVGYRPALATQFPRAVHDAYGVALWCSKNAVRLGINPDSIAVGGDSTGGNLAVVVAQMNHDERQFPIALQLLIYPATSCERNASGYS